MGSWVWSSKGPTWEASSASWSVSMAATIRPVSASRPRCSFFQDRRVRVPCFSISHSPAPQSFRCRMGLGCHRELDVPGRGDRPHSAGVNGVEWRPQASRRTAMEYFAAIDVSLELSSVCVVDGTGRIVREAKVASEPDALIRCLRESGLVLTRIGLEAGPLSQWLHAGLTEAGFEAVLLETRHGKAALRARTMKTQTAPDACVRRGAEVVVHRAPGGEVAGREPPLAPRPQQVEDGVEH